MLLSAFFFDGTVTCILFFFLGGASTVGRRVLYTFIRMAGIVQWVRRRCLHQLQFVSFLEGGGGGVGGSTKGVLLSKTHFFEISVKKPTKMGVPGRKSPWGSPIYPNKPPDDLHRAFLFRKKLIFCEKKAKNCVTFASRLVTKI